MPNQEGRFATQLYHALRQQPGNFFVSPASIQLAFSMAWAGARGETASQMQQVLGARDAKAAHDANAEQLRRWDTLANPPDNNGDAGRAAASPEMQKYYEQRLAQRRITLSVVNRLWAQSGRHLRPDYTALLQASYRAPVAQADFQHAPEPSRVEINRWVSEQTKKKIPELLAKRTITDATRVVLVNAIYFKATWQYQFSKYATKDQPFHTAGKDVSVPLMHDVGHYQLARVDGGQILELPYGDGDLAMDVILPTAQDGLGAIEKALVVAGALPGWLAKLQRARVDVSLPRWKTTSAMQLADTLAAMGAKLAFQYPGADFSGIDDTHELFLSQVVHQAVVEVNEEGTEAAAATAMMAAAGAAPPTEPPTVFRADHPFVYLIRDTKTGAILFLGRLVDPSAPSGT